MDDGPELGDAIRERLGNNYWRCSEQWSGAAAIGANVIRDLLDYADEIADETDDGDRYAEKIRRIIAAHMGVDVNSEVSE